MSHNPSARLARLIICASCAGLFAAVFRLPIVYADARVRITCTPNCVADHAPAIGTSTVITVESGGHPAHLALRLHGPLGAVTCTLPCRTMWLGPARIRVLADGRESSITVEHGAVVSAVSEEELTIADLLGIDTHEFQKITGGNTTTVERHVRTESQRNQFITGGQDVPSAQGSSDRDALDRYFDDVVLLEGTGVGCTGVAISSRNVLTARHCSGANRISVVHADGQRESIAVVSRVAPPDDSLDVMVLTSAKDLAVPVRSRIHQLAPAPAEGLVRIIGFGASDPSGRAGFGTKRQANVSITDWSCDPRLAAETGCKTSTELVITTPQADTCNGDSGGPVLELVNGEWLLAAITSRALPGSGTACGGGGIYTDVGAIDEWLSQVISGGKS